MAADDRHKKREAVDDAIARAMERQSEAARGEETNPPKVAVQSGMDSVGVTPRRRKTAAPEDSARPSDDGPTFFTRSREERAARAQRAAQRVRRREPESENELTSTEPHEGASVPKTGPETPPAEQRPAQNESRSRETPSPAPSPESAPAPSADAERQRLAVEGNLKRLRKLPLQGSGGADTSAEPSDPPESKRSNPTPVQSSAEKPPVAKVSAPASAAALIERATSGRPRQQAADPLPQSAAEAKTPRSEKPNKRNASLAAMSKRKSAALPQRGAGETKATPSASGPALRGQALRRDPKLTELRVDAAPESGASSQPATRKTPEQAVAASRMPSFVADEIAPFDPVVAPHPALKTAKTKAFAPFEWMIASRYLRARKKEGFVSVIAGFSLVGIALGVATLIIVMAVMTGFRETLIEQIVGVNAHLNVTSQTEKFEDYDPLAAAIREVDGVESVTPLVQGQVLANSDRGHSGVIVRGMRAEDLRRLRVATAPEVSQGSLDEFEGENGVAIGTRLAAKLGLRVGDFITLISPDGDITPFSATPMPRKKDYRILYTFQLGLYEYDSAFVYMPLDQAQIYFNKQNQIDSLEVMVENPNQPEDYVSDIRRASNRSIGVYTWKDLNGGLIGALDIERKVMFVILTMIILVAALNIISGLVMLVKDKTRDIAIMRTMGIARGSVLRIFFICGASIGVIGSIVGVILGVAFSMNIGAIQKAIEGITGASLWDPSVRMLSEVPAKLVPSDVLLTLFIALGLSFLATLYPAWKAAKLDPVEALRYE